MCDMTATFYQNKSERTRLTKTLNNPTTVTAYFDKQSEVDIMHPIIRVGNYGITQFNYVWLSDTNRYYFVDDVENLHNKQLLFHLTVDVLTTYQNEIRQLYALIDRQKGMYNLYYPDNLPTLAYERVQTQLFPNQPIYNGVDEILLCVSNKGGV